MTLKEGHHSILASSLQPPGEKNCLADILMDKDEESHKDGGGDVHDGDEYDGQGGDVDEDDEHDGDGDDDPRRVKALNV